MPSRNMPSSGPLKNPITAKAASTIDPILAKYTPTAATVTTAPQAKVTQRAFVSVTSFAFVWRRLNRWMKSTQVTVLNEFKPEENTDMVAANKLAKTRPPNPDGSTCKMKW